MEINKNVRRIQKSFYDYDFTDSIIESLRFDDRLVNFIVTVDYYFTESMEALATFKMKNNRRIEFLVNGLAELEEYGYFTDLKIIYHFEDKKVLLFDDFLTEGVKTFIAVLQMCINGEMALPQEIFEKGIGYEWTKECHKIAEENFDEFDVASKFLMWETVQDSMLATYIYNFEGKTYLEIAPEYKFHFIDPEPDEEFISYESFLSNYKIIDGVELDPLTITQWQSEASAIINNL